MPAASLEILRNGPGNFLCHFECPINLASAMETAELQQRRKRVTQKNNKLHFEVQQKLLRSTLGLGKNMLLTSLHFVANRLALLPRPQLHFAGVAGKLPRQKFPIYVSPRINKGRLLLHSTNVVSPCLQQNVNVVTKGTQLCKCGGEEDKCLKIYNNK